MGKNDLLSEDDFFTLNDKNETPSDEPDRQQSKEEDELFKELEFDRPVPSEDAFIPELIIDEADDQPVPVTTAGTSNVEEVAPAPEIPAEETKEPTSTYRYDFEDDTQQGVNYKPTLIGILVVAVLVIGAYFIWDYFIAEKEPVVVEEVEQGPSPEEIARTNFYSALNGKTHYQNAQIGKIISIASNESKISSLMLYENDLVFEVFSKDRAALAQYLRQLQNNFGSGQVSLSTTTERPGSRGGVFGQFAVTLDKGGSKKADVADPITSTDNLKSWLNRLAEGNQLQISDVRSSSIPKRDIYQGTQIEALLKGSMKDLSTFINQLAISNKNLIVHKLSLISTDLKNFSQKKYQLRMILKTYM